MKRVGGLGWTQPASAERETDRSFYAWNVLVISKDVNDVWLGVQTLLRPLPADDVQVKRLITVSHAGVITPTSVSPLKIVTCSAGLGLYLVQSM